jgi:quercetin dioxygenase-like cupin family protein
MGRINMGTISKPNLQVKNIANPDERRAFVAKGHAEMVKLPKATVMHAVFEPGWRWSQHVKPLVGTHSCEATHLAYVMSGRMHIAMDDGTETEIGPGDFVQIAPGHDAWVEGNEPCVMVDFGGYEQYARPTAPRQGAGAGAGSQRPTPRK